MRLFLVLLITIFIATFFGLVSKAYAISILEVEGKNFLNYFSDLESLYLSTPKDAFEEFDDKNKITSEEFVELRENTFAIAESCDILNTEKEGQRYIQNISKPLQKLKLLESLNTAATEFETSISSYITNCSSENEYNNNKLTINNILSESENSRIITNTLNDPRFCEAEEFSVVDSSTKQIKTAYDKVRSYTDKITTSYNISALRISEAENLIKFKTSDNEELGELTTRVLQDLKFLRSKKNTEIQEIAILQRNLKDDYLALTSSEIYKYYDALEQTFINDNLLAISLDNRNTWYSFHDQKDFFQFLKLLNNSNAEVRLIQDKSLEILNKKDSIISINASEISKSVILDQTTFKIGTNINDINLLNKELSNLTPKIEKYGDYVIYLKEEDYKLRTDIANMTDSIELCGSYATEKLRSFTSKTEELPLEVKGEIKKQYETEFSEKDYQVVLNPESIAQTNPSEILRITSDYMKFESRFTSCENNDRLEILNEKKIISSNEVKGVINFSLTSEDAIDLNDFFRLTTTNYSQPVKYIDINHFSNFINKELIENPQSYTNINDQNITITPISPWAQNIELVEETYNIYDCMDSIWNNNGSKIKSFVEYSECKLIETTPITFDYRSNNQDMNQVIMSNINKYISSNNIKVKGTCSN